MSDEAAQEPGFPVEVPAEFPAAERGPAPAEPEFPAAPPLAPTGDRRVDAVVARLGELGARPVPEHVEIYEDVHQRLQELLASADQDDRPEHPEHPGRPEAPRAAFPDALRPRP
ncbi:hypothetical protein E1281_07005 [Actinomadura sp. KC345]|uniref:hypothetical protein n=1 Tax=Actinomadura sp. KC345 TaxID=2530371 RepID=UPI001047970B|nr:hypothetical protein [Actinomadura sp. KC345]TDC56496.1 hypothetical protein E1281_07005 [Actinomadura sp. KC345]